MIGEDIVHEEPTNDKPNIIHINIEQLRANNVRMGIDQAEIAELAETINKHGIVNPIIVRRHQNTFYILSGHRRVLAAKQSGLARVPCIVKTMDDSEALEIELITNVQRKDLTAYEIGKTLDSMLKSFPHIYPTQKALTSKIGKNVDWVSNHLAIVEFEDRIDARRLQEMTHTQARELRRLPSKKQDEIIKQIVETGTIPTSRRIAELGGGLPLDASMDEEQGDTDGRVGEIWICEQQNWYSSIYVPEELVEDINSYFDFSDPHNQSTKAYRKRVLKQVISTSWKYIKENGLMEDVLTKARIAS